MARCRHLCRRRGSPGSGYEWLKVDAASGRTSPLFDADRMETALASLPGVTRAEAGLIARSNDLTFNPARTGALVTIADDLYFYDVAAAKASRLTTTSGTRRRRPSARTGSSSRSCAPTISTPSTSRRRRSGRSRPTADARSSTASSTGCIRRRSTAAIASAATGGVPTRTRVAFLQLDERPVPEYTVVDHIPYRPSLEVTDYPKAGDPNPAVKLGVASVSGGATAVDRSRRVRVRRLPDRQRGLDTGCRGRSCIRSRTASRPGST